MTLSRAKGSRLERNAKRRLEEEGYVVIRAAGSHGPFDLVALRSKAERVDDSPDGSDVTYEILCVQVKANRKPTRRQVEAMCQVPVPSEVWVHKDRAEVWDVYEPTPDGLEVIRREPYVPYVRLTERA